MINDEVLNILGTEVAPGESTTVNFEVAKLHTQNQMRIPIIIERSKTPGPTVLITAGIHGDEVNGVEIVRQVIAKGINQPKMGTIICVPVINVFGFIHMNREFPDGRDLNRVFPGSKQGSLASRVAYALMTEVVPHADVILDFHTGGANRFNAPQIRISPKQTHLQNLAECFGAPFIVHAKSINKSYRHACSKLGIPMLLFEGGKSVHINNNVTKIGVRGVKRVLQHLGMLNKKFSVATAPSTCITISHSKWVRAKHSGMFKPKIKLQAKVFKGDIIGSITDPYGNFNYKVKAPQDGYIFNINESPIIYQGDALFHISTEIKN